MLHQSRLSQGTELRNVYKNQHILKGNLLAWFTVCSLSGQSKNKLSPNRRTQQLFSPRGWSLVCVGILTKPGLTPVKVCLGSRTDRLTSQREGKQTKSEGSLLPRPPRGGPDGGRIFPPEMIQSRETSHRHAQLLGLQLIPGVDKGTAKLSCSKCRCVIYNLKIFLSFPTKLNLHYLMAESTLRLLELVVSAQIKVSETAEDREEQCFHLSMVSWLFLHNHLYYLLHCIDKIPQPRQLMRKSLIGLTVLGGQSV